MLWSEIYTAEWSRLELLLWQAPLGPCRYCHLFSYAVQCPYRPLEPCAAVSPHVPPAARLLPWCLDRLATSLDHGSHWSTGTSTYSLLLSQFEGPQPPPWLPATLPSPAPLHSKALTGASEQVFCLPVETNSRFLCVSLH